MRHEAADTVVVGGGLAGLTAALYLARGRRRVRLFESGRLGGRASTRERGGFFFNEGPHALYRAGAATRILGELGVAWTGADPATAYARAVVEGRLHELPRSAESMMSTGALSPGAKAEAAELLARFPGMDLSGVDRVSVAQWLEAEVRTPEVRQLLLMLNRLATYSNSPELESAAAHFGQVQLGFAGVFYLDGGWQTLIDGLRRAALAAGVELHEEERVKSVRPGGGGYEVATEAGTTGAGSVVLAVRPAVAAALAPDSRAFAEWAERAVPARAACLDLGLRRLPNPEVQFALGMDRPLYMSVHTRSARLAPEGGAVIQAAKYLGSDPPADGAAVERELEELMDLTQPGWREEVVERRYLPNMIVTNWVPTATSAGLAGRPGPAVPDAPGLFIAGDWVGEEGMLADGALASAREAARLALAQETTRVMEHANA